MLYGTYANSTFNHGFFFSGEPDGSFIRCAVNVVKREPSAQQMRDEQFYVDETGYGEETSEVDVPVRMVTFLLMAVANYLLLFGRLF